MSVFVALLSAIFVVGMLHVEQPSTSRYLVFLRKCFTGHSSKLHPTNREYETAKISNVREDLGVPSNSVVIRLISIG